MAKRRTKKKVFSAVKAVKANARERVGQPKAERVIDEKKRAARREEKHKPTLQSGSIWMSDSIDRMASITIRKIDALVLQQLCAQAEEHGRTAEEEARQILCNAIIHDGKQTGLSLFLPMRQRMAEAGIRGITLPQRRRSRMRKPPSFD